MCPVKYIVKYNPRGTYLLVNCTAAVAIYSNCCHSTREKALSSIIRSSSFITSSTFFMLCFFLLLCVAHSKYTTEGIRIYETHRNTSKKSRDRRRCVCSCCCVLTYTNSRIYIPSLADNSRRHRAAAQQYTYYVRAVDADTRTHRGTPSERLCDRTFYTTDRYIYTRTLRRAVVGIFVIFRKIYLSPLSNLSPPIGVSIRTDVRYHTQFGFAEKLSHGE